MTILLPTQIWVDIVFKMPHKTLIEPFWLVLEITDRYAGLLLAPAKGFGLRPRLFMLFWLILGHFWCSVVTSLTLTSKKSQKSQKISKIPKKSLFFQKI